MGIRRLGDVMGRRAIQLHEYASDASDGGLKTRTGPADEPDPFVVGEEL